MESIYGQLAEGWPTIVAAVLVIAKILNTITAKWSEGSLVRRILKAVINLLDQFRLEAFKDVPKILKDTKKTGSVGRD